MTLLKRFRRWSRVGFPIGLAAMWLLAAPRTAHAQVIAPYVFSNCEASPTYPIPTPPNGVCDPQQQFNTAGATPVPIAATSVAITPDGTRVFVGSTFLIEVFQRDVNTGVLTYESCIEDGRGDAPAMPVPCQLTPALALSSYTTADPIQWLAVSPDGANLYASTLHTLVALSVGPSLGFVDCWKTATDFDSTSHPGPCKSIDTGSGLMFFDWIQSPVVSPDGNQVYAAVTSYDAPGNIDPARVRRGAVLRFTRDGLGDLSYTDCAGVLEGRTITYNDNGSVNTVNFYTVPCADSAVDIRNLTRLQVSADGGSVYVAGSASDVLYASDAVARLARSATGALTFAQCTLVPTGSCVPGAGAAMQNGPSEIQVSADSRDVYVNSRPPAHLRLTSGSLSSLADFSAPAQFYIDLLGGRRFAFDAAGALFSPTSGSFGRLSVWDRNATTGALTYRGCAASSYQNYDPGCDLLPPGYGGDYITTANQPGAMITFGYGAVPGDTLSEGPLLASFQRGQILKVTAGANGTVTSSPGSISCGSTCQNTFLNGTSVTLTATPAANYMLSTWGGDCSGTTSPCVLTMDADKAVTVTFSKIQYSITASTTTGGTVTSSPAGINCGSTCVANFDVGTTVTLTAGPAANYVFGGWTGFCSSLGATQTQCVVLMNQNITAGATFTQVVPEAPSSFNAIVTATKVGKKTTYSGSLTWQDNSTIETQFLIQRYTKAKGKCSLDTGFGTRTVGANVTTYTDTTASSAVCGYQIASANGASYQSTWVRDMNVGSGVTP